MIREREFVDIFGWVC